MKFRRPRELSSNIEDRRAAGPQRRGGRTAVGLGGAGGGVAIIALLVAMCSGGGGGAFSPAGDATSLSGDTGAGTTLDDSFGEEDAALTDEAALASVVLDNAQIFWDEVFAENGLTYRDATMVLYRAATPTACGQGDARMGPFYCSLDDTIYLDLSFWAELERRFGTPAVGDSGDFAQAYVIAHEVAHHVQNLLGISQEVRTLGAQNPADRNALSVAQELQADCFSGVWANSVWTDGDVGDPAGIEIEESDIREALAAAAAVGDDNIQLRTTGQINQDTWTHGSADQREEWFTRGFETGDPSSCDTFS